MWDKKDYERRRPSGYYISDYKLTTPKHKKEIVIVNGVEYRQIGERDPAWHLYSSGKLAAHQHYYRAVDGSNRVVVGPEELTNPALGFKENYYYVSALGDYYTADYCMYRSGEWVIANNQREYDCATFVTQTDTDGFIEHMLLTAERPVEKLERMTFELKDLVEKEKGKKLTVLDQIKWFKDHPTVELHLASDEKERYDRMRKILRAYPKEADLWSDDEI